MPRITLYPQYGAMGGMYGMQAQTEVLKAKAKTAMAMREVAHVKDIANLKIGALSKIHDVEKENVRLKAQMQYGGGWGYPGGGMPGYWQQPMPYAMPAPAPMFGAWGGAGMLGALRGWF